MVKKEKYDEYCESLLNIARLTKKENSILINFRVEGDNCYNVVSFIQQDGTKDILKDDTFVCDDEFFKDMLEEFIVKYCNSMSVAFNDSVDLNADGKYTYRVVTIDNDLMSVDGISLDYANYLMEISKKKKNDSMVENSEALDFEGQRGLTNILMTLILTGCIGISFLLMILLLG